MPTPFTSDQSTRVAEWIKREFWYQHALAKLYTNRRSKRCCTRLSKRPFDSNRALGLQPECMQLIYNTDALVCFLWFMPEGYSDVALIPTSQSWYQSCHQIDKKKEEDAWQWDSEHEKMVGWIQSCQQMHTMLWIRAVCHKEQRKGNINELLYFVRYF